MKVKHRPAVPTCLASEQLASLTSRGGSSDFFPRGLGCTIQQSKPFRRPLSYQCPFSTYLAGKRVIAIHSESAGAGRCPSSCDPAACNTSHRTTALLWRPPSRPLRTSSFLEVHTTPIQFVLLQGEPKAGRRPPLVDWDVGKKREVLVLIRDRGKTVLFEYDRWEVLSMHRKSREGKQIKAESTALWLEYPTRPQEALAQLSALLTAFLSTALNMAHFPSLFNKRCRSFSLCLQDRIICCVLAKLLG